MSVDWGAVERGTRQVLEGLGCDLSDPNFSATPARVARAYREIFSGLYDVDRQIDEILTRTFPCEHQQMIVARNVEVFGVCPHHLLPVHYLVTVGYMPSEHGSVLGLSKLCRIAKLLAARPVLQEQVVNDIATALMRIPDCKGAGCIVHGEHLCMRMRGVNQADSVVVTSSLAGVFRDNAMVRSEFMTLYR